MGILIDTSVLIRLEREVEAGRAMLPLADFFVSVVTLSELLVGIHRGTEGRRRIRKVFADRVFTELVVLDIDASIARLHARLTADMLTLGRPTGVHDLWIAATAIQHGVEIMTLDTHSFPHIPGVRLAAIP